MAQHMELDVLGGGRAAHQQHQSQHLPDDQSRSWTSRSSGSPSSKARPKTEWPAQRAPRSPGRDHRLPRGGGKAGGSGCGEAGRVAQARHGEPDRPNGGRWYGPRSDERAVARPGLAQQAPCGEDVALLAGE
jgi:hypothetical protein